MNFEKYVAPFQGSVSCSADSYYKYLRGAAARKKLQSSLEFVANNLQS